jgi:hypothetical protein
MFHGQGHVSRFFKKDQAAVGGLGQTAGIYY